MTEPSLLQYMSSIDSRLENIENKFDHKTDKEDHRTLTGRVEGLETKHQNLAVKVAGIAGGISTVLTLLGWLFKSP